MIKLFSLIQHVHLFRNTQNRFHDCELVSKRRPSQSLVWSGSFDPVLARTPPSTFLFLPIHLSKNTRCLPPRTGRRLYALGRRIPRPDFSDRRLLSFDGDVEGEPFRRLRRRRPRCGAYIDAALSNCQHPFETKNARKTKNGRRQLPPTWAKARRSAGFALQKKIQKRFEAADPPRRFGHPTQFSDVFRLGKNAQDVVAPAACCSAKRPPALVYARAYYT